MVFKIEKVSEFKQARDNDLIRMLPAAKGNNPMYVEKYKLISLVLAIVYNEIVHLSGPTGTGKTSLLHALIDQPLNWRWMCTHLNIAFKRLRVFAHSAVSFESPAELFYRRAIGPDGTFDEPSYLLQDLKKLYRHADRYYNAMWISEMLRMPSTVQNAFVELINQKSTDAKGKVIGKGKKIAWIFDSNYQAAQDERFFFELSQFDEALKARNTVCLTFDYLSQQQEIDILSSSLSAEDRKDIPDMVLALLVEMAANIRQGKFEGKYEALPMPTFRQYLGFLKLLKRGHLTVERLAEVVLFGFASEEDLVELRELFESTISKYEKMAMRA